MRETEFEGKQVAFAVENTTTAHDVAAALIGCTFYLEDPDVVWEITGAEWPGPVFVMQSAAGPQRLTVPRLARGYIVELCEQSRLAPLIAKATPPHIAAAEDARRWLAKAGIHHPSLSNDDALQLADALSALDAHQPPSFRARALITGLLRRYGFQRIYIGIATAWLEAALPKGERPLADVIIQLVSAYREINDHAAALQCTDIVLTPESAGQLSPVERAILFTQRSAIHLDLYDRSRDAVRLKSARKCAAKAWSIQPSDECSAVYNRLTRAEEELEEQQASAARLTQHDRMEAMKRAKAASNFRPRGS